MRRRETKRLEELLGRFQIPKLDGYYLWANLKLWVGSYRIQYRTYNPVGGIRQLRWVATKAWEVLDWLVKDNMEVYPDLFLYSCLTPDRSEIAFTLSRFYKGSRANLPRQLFPLAHGLFTHQVPLDIFMDALKHDTDLLDNIPILQQQGSFSS